MRLRFATQRGWMLSIIVLLAAACATANVPPPKPLADGDLKRVVGRWTGIFDFRGTGMVRSEHAFLIREDGTYHETGPGLISSGTVEIRDGAVIFDGSQTRGRLQLHDNGSQRMLGARREAHWPATLVHRGSRPI